MNIENTSIINEGYLFMPFDRATLDQEGQAKLQSISAFYNSVESALNIQSDGFEKLHAMTHLIQSYMWFVRLLEREQLEKNYVKRQQPTQTQNVSLPIQPESKLSPDATIIAESRKGLDSLKNAIKELTDTVAVTGINL